MGFKNSCPVVRRDIPEPENSMEGICPSLREFKDSQEVELVIERVPPRDKEDQSEYTE